jgi:hypothetical protein
VTILGLVTPISATNLTEQYQLCKTDAEIEALQITRNLTRVDARPVHGALHPSWPETLVTVIFSMYGLIPGDPDSKPGFVTLVSKAVIPFIMVLAWTVSFVIAEINYSTAGWISPNLVAPITAFFTATQYQESGSDNLIGNLASLLSLLLGILQFFASFALIGQRFAAPTYTVWSPDPHLTTTFNLTRLGSVAYQITDFHGCLPRNGTAYLEKGARSDIFRAIQTVQANYSCLILVILFIMLKSDREVKKWAVAFCTFLLSFPLLIYEADMATKGRPVVMSGDCMLVELDPRLGFLDTDIDNWWKALVGITGL